MKNLLFISTVTPNPQGGGTEQRGYHTLKALSTRFRIFLLITGQPETVCTALSDIATSIESLPLQPWRDPKLCWRLLLLSAIKHGIRLPRQLPEQGLGVTRQRLHQAVNFFNGVDFVRIHAFRLWNAPFAWAWAHQQPSAALQIDLDELDSNALEQIASLPSSEAKPSMRSQQLLAAKGALVWENRWLTRFPQIFVSSENEVQKLTQAGVSGRTFVVPNVYESTVPAAASEKGRETFTFLFVGSFAYSPNLDAAYFFIEKVLPHLLKAAPVPVQLMLVGRGLISEHKVALTRHPSVKVVGEVPDMCAWYAKADAVVVPLRAGGGTRIKILEAFVHQRPVVSTQVGAEGLGVTDRQHLLLANTAEEFVKACLCLMNEQSLRDELVHEASQLAIRKYSPQVMEKCLLDTEDNLTP